MDRSTSWRELLGKIISDVHERQRIATTLGINPATLTRWAANETNPRPQNLRELLRFLAHEGRTNANCWAVDLFFCNSQGWERDWGDLDLPEQIHDVLAKMGEALHDTVGTPDIAQNFGCLPEQLLEALEANPRM